MQEAASHFAEKGNPHGTDRARARTVSFIAPTAASAASPLPPPPRHKTVHLVDIDESTIRRAGDLVNVVLCAIGIAFVLLLAVYGRETTEGVAADVQQVVNRTARQILLLPITALEGLIMVLIPLVVLVSRIIRRQWRALWHAAIAGMAAAILTWLAVRGIDMLPTANPLRSGLSFSIQANDVPPMSPYVASLAALLTAAGKGSTSRVMRWLWYSFALVLFFAVLQGDQSIVGIIVAVLLGRLVGFLVRWIFGVTSTRATGIALIAGLRRAGIDPGRVVRLDVDDDEQPRAWFVSSSAPVGHNAQFGASTSGPAAAVSNSADSRPPQGPSSGGSSQTESHTGAPGGSSDIAALMAALGADRDSITPDPRPIDERELELLHSRHAADLGDLRAYAAWDDDRRMDVMVLDGDRQVVGFLSNLWETLRIRGADRRMSPSLREGAERALLMSFTAAAAGVSTPRIRGVALASDSIVVIEDHIPGGHPLSSVEDVPDSVLDELWSQIRSAHDRGIAHRSLKASNILLDSRDAVWILGWREGEVASSELSRRIDLAQVLTMLASQFGTERALASAYRNLSERQLSSIAPLLQRATLPASTRAKTSAKTLSDLRESLTSLIPTADGEPLQLRRFSPKTVLTISLLLVATVIVVGSLNFDDVINSFRNASPWWLVAAFAAALSTYWGAALGLTAFTPEKLGVWRTTLVQVASSIVAIVAPAGVGPAAIDIRFLTKQGVKAPLAVATVTLTMVTRFVVTVLLLVAVTLLTGSGGTIALPSGALLIGIGVVLLVVGVLVAIPGIRTWLWAKAAPILQQVWPRVIWVLGNPKRLLVGFVGNVIMTAGFVLAFGFTLQAFGYSLPVAVLAITYLASNSAGALVPAPAGIGPVELALTSGLTVAGIPASIALSVTLVFRVLTLWARVPLGWAALRHLQKKNIL